MRTAVSLVIPVVLAALLAGCEDAEDPTMPDVTGQQLDVALTAIDEAGVTSEPEVEGGGLFGIVEQANWQVCSQEPSAGSPVASTPKLTVERDCATPADGEQEPDDAEAPPAPEASETAEPTPDASAEPPTAITVDNNADFAALLTLTDYCSADIQRFAATYAGQTVEFDANIAYMNSHDGYDTRYDFLITAGDFSETSSVGPNFQFRDKSVLDLNLEGDNAPDSVGIGQNIHAVATVGDYSANQCLFQLRPVVTTIR